jgi:hypothetical protein
MAKHTPKGSKGQTGKQLTKVPHAPGTPGGTEVRSGKYPAKGAPRRRLAMVSLRAAPVDAQQKGSKNMKAAKSAFNRMNKKGRKS